MSLLITILRAAHCRSTHHFFAVDALEHVQTEEGKRLASLLLSHHERYLLGAKDPDKKFRDFQNHVLHVSDNHWGGACKAAEKWLGATIDSLNQRRWGESAYCIGVLSHYFTDPLMPLHTGSSDAEGAVHRPMEWSVCKSYETILEKWETSSPRHAFELSEGDDWISDAVTLGAELSHPHYERLIAIYNLEQGAKNPPAGLNQESHTILAEMFGYAITGMAAIIDRIAYACRVDIPDFNVTIPTLMAGISMPSAWIIKKIESDDEKRAVAAILDEYQRTGTVKKNLPPEIRTVRSLAPIRKPDGSQSIRKAEPKPMPAAEKPTREVRPETPARLHGNKAPVTKPQVAKPEPTPIVSAPTDTIPTPSIDDPKPHPIVQPSEPRHEDRPNDSNVRSPKRLTPSKQNSPRRASVSEASDLVDAPSIGPKTAKRFAKIGIHTIGQFLAADPKDMESRLATGWINEQLLIDWKDQARLVCRVPALCGYKAQLLVGVECRTEADLAKKDAGRLQAEIADFAATKPGERILRSSSPPDTEEIQKWIDDARGSEVRAA